MKLEELFELKFKNLNFNKKQSEDIDDFVERINQNLNFWVEKKQNSVVQPIINGFSKAYNIESQVLTIIAQDTYDANKNDNKCFDEVLVPNLQNDVTITGKVSPGSEKVQKFIDKINKRCILNKNHHKKKLKSKKEVAIENNTDKPNQKKSDKKKNNKVNETDGQPIIVDKDKDNSKNYDSQGSTSMTKKSHMKNFIQQKNQIYLNEYCEVILDTSHDLRPFSDKCEDYTSQIPIYFLSIGKSKIFKQVFRKTILEVLTQQVYSATTPSITDQQKLDRSIEKDSDFLLFLIKKNFKKLKKQVQSIMQNYQQQQSENSSDKNPTFTKAKKLLTLNFLDLLQIKLNSNKLKTIEPDISNILILKEILSQKKEDIITAYKNIPEFDSMIKQIKNLLVERITANESHSNADSYDQTHIKPPVKYKKSMNNLTQFYQTQVEVSGKKFPSYEQTCEFLSKKTPVLFKKYYKIKDVKNILRLEFWHAYTMTENLDIKVHSSKFNKVFGELLVEQLRDFVKDFMKGYKLVRNEQNREKVYIKQKFLQAVLIAIYDKIPHTKAGTIESLVKTLATINPSKMNYKSQQFYIFLETLKRNMDDADNYNQNTKKSKIGRRLNNPGGGGGGSSNGSATAIDESSPENTNAQTTSINNNYLEGQLKEDRSGGNKDYPKILLENNTQSIFQNEILKKKYFRRLCMKTWTFLKKKFMGKLGLCNKLSGNTPNVFYSYKSMDISIKKIFIDSYNNAYDFCSLKSEKDYFYKRNFRKLLKETILKNLTKVQLVIDNMKDDLHMEFNEQGFDDNSKVALLLKIYDFLYEDLKLTKDRLKAFFYQKKLFRNFKQDGYGSPEFDVFLNELEHYLLRAFKKDKNLEVLGPDDPDKNDASKNINEIRGNNFDEIERKKAIDIMNHLEFGKGNNATQGGVDQVKVSDGIGKGDTIGDNSNDGNDEDEMEKIMKDLQNAQIETHHNSYIANNYKIDSEKIQEHLQGAHSQVNGNPSNDIYQNDSEKIMENLQQGNTGVGSSEEVALVKQTQEIPRNHNNQNQDIDALKIMENLQKAQQAEITNNSGNDQEQLQKSHQQRINDQQQAPMGSQNVKGNGQIETSEKNDSTQNQELSDSNIPQNQPNPPQAKKSTRQLYRKSVEFRRNKKQRKKIISKETSQAQLQGLESLYRPKSHDKKIHRTRRRSRRMYRSYQPELEDSIDEDPYDSDQISSFISKTARKPSKSQKRKLKKSKSSNTVKNASRHPRSTFGTNDFFIKPKFQKFRKYKKLLEAEKKFRHTDVTPPKPSRIPDLNHPQIDSINYNDPDNTENNFASDQSNYTLTPKVELQLKRQKEYRNSMAFYQDLQKLITYSMILPEEIMTKIEGCGVDLSQAKKRCDNFHKLPNFQFKNCEEISSQMVTSPCPENYQKSGSLCTKMCPDGYTRLKDECQKPKAIFRDSYTSKRHCLEQGNKLCERFDSKFYHDCKLGYVSIYKICVAGCPPGWTDNGKTCMWEDNIGLRAFSWNLGD